MTDRIYYSRDAELQANRQRATLALFVLGVGVGMGAVLAMLFAPQAGEKTRQTLAHQAEHAFEGGREATEKVVETLQGEVARLRREVEDRVNSR